MLAPRFVKTKDGLDVAGTTRCNLRGLWRGSDVSCNHPRMPGIVTRNLWGAHRDKRTCSLNDLRAQPGSPTGDGGSRNQGP
jgi:hypothetical protein